MEINELENKVRMCEDERTTAMKQYDAAQQQNRQSSDEHRKEMANITLTSDDLKMKVSNSRTILDAIFACYSYTELNWRGTSYSKHCNCVNSDILKK